MTLFASKGEGGGKCRKHMLLFSPCLFHSSQLRNTLTPPYSLARNEHYKGGPLPHPPPMPIIQKETRGMQQRAHLSLDLGGGDAHSCSLPKKILPPPQRIQKPGEEENDSWQPRAPLCPRPPPQPSCVRTTAHNHTTVWGGFLDHKA